MRYAAALLLVVTGVVTASSAAEESVEALLKQLASADPKQRDQASEQLLSKGAAARPAVLAAAAEAASPEVRARASELVLKLPWGLASDPPDVQRVLTKYGEQDTATRTHLVATLERLGDSAGIPALARLLEEEPSDQVRWAIVAALHNNPVQQVEQALTKLRNADPDGQPAPVLAGMALARRTSDVSAARSLYRRASETMARDGASAQMHLMYGEILHEHGWRSLARRELETALAMPGPHPPLVEAAVRFQLASLIGDEDDRLAADHLRQGMAAFARISGGGVIVERGGEVVRSNDALADLRALMHFRYYRAAIKEGKAGSEHLEKLLELKPARADVALEVVPLLKELGRQQEAAELFERAYRLLREAVDADPESAEHMNNLAWLCARCDERLEEAVKLATRALEISPENAAYLDTAAEAHFRTGNRQKAIELETRALKLRPGDEFMLQQLMRFQRQ